MGSAESGGASDDEGRTRRDSDRDGRTRRDRSQPNGGRRGRTRRDRDAPGQSEPSRTRRENEGLRVGLPPGLADRFEELEVLPGGGAEGFVFVCRDHDRQDALCAVKVYGLGVIPDRRVHDALLKATELGHVHVVRLDEVLESGGHVVEVLEWAEHGSLDKLMSTAEIDDLPALVDRLCRAVSDFQRVVRGGHFDIKPANVLVRSIAPLSLVLGDLGLARVMDGSVRFSAQAGTVAYAPPEAGRGWGQVAKSTAWDWWSVGIIVTEVALARHPLSLPDGSMPTDRELALSPELLGHRRVDLSALHDSRLRLLCSGLLTPDDDRRWGTTQVAQWLDGGSPDVQEGLVRGERSRPGQTTSVLFANVEYDKPSDLVVAFQSDWLRAQELLFQDRDRALIDETEALAKIWSIDDVGALLAQPAPQEIPRRMAQLLVALDPQLEPLYDSVDLRPGGLERAALTIVEDPGSVDAERTDRRLEAIRSAQVLRLWRHTTGLSHATTLEREWNERNDAIAGLVATVELHTPTEEDLRVTRAKVLLASLHPDHERRLIDEAEALEVDPDHSPAWWDRLRSGGNAAAAALAAATFPAAEGVAARDRKRAEQDRAAQRAAEEEQRRRRRQEQEQRERERRDRRQRAIGSVVRAAIVVGVAWWAAFVPLAFVTQIWAGSSVSEGQGGGFAELMGWVNLFGVIAIGVSIAGYSWLVSEGRYGAIDYGDQLAGATAGFGVAAIAAVAWFSSKGGPSEGDWFMGPLGAVIGLVFSFLRATSRDR